MHTFPPVLGGKPLEPANAFTLYIYSTIENNSTKSDFVVLPDTRENK